MKGRVYLVGAGCSAADLITVRGKRLIERCEVLIYDDLIDKSLLYLAPEDAILEPVGKRGGRCSAKQMDINALIIKYAKEGRMVVRLKGGDPYVFGRGGEEALALMEEDIPFSVVPGISAGIAVPMEYGIPVTHRGKARSLHFITGHTKDADTPLPEDIENLAKVGGTLVFFMGISHLEDIQKALIKYGKSPDTPAAIVSGGNSDNPICIRSTLEKIVDAAKREGAQSPALIMVGEVTAMDLLSTGAHPLAGIRVGLTGTDSFCARLRPLLWDMGAKVSQVQKATCHVTKAQIPWEEIIGKEDAWIVFLSANGVRTFFEKMKRDGRDIRTLAGKKVAVIGKATGDFLGTYGIIADLCPGVYTKESLAADLAEINKGEEIYLFDSEKGSESLREDLENRGCSAHRITIYDTDYHTVEESLECDYIIFGSAGAVRALYQDGYKLPEGAKPVCIGPVAKKAFIECYATEPIVPDEITCESIVDRIIQLV